MKHLLLALMVTGSLCGMDQKNEKVQLDEAIVEECCPIGKIKSVRNFLESPIAWDWQGQPVRGREVFSHKEGRCLAFEALLNRIRSLSQLGNLRDDVNQIAGFFLSRGCAEPKGAFRPSVLFGCNVFEDWLEQVKNLDDPLEADKWEQILIAMNPVSYVDHLVSLRSFSVFNLLFSGAVLNEENINTFFNTGTYFTGSEKSRLFVKRDLEFLRALLFFKNEFDGGRFDREKIEQFRSCAYSYADEQECRAMFEDFEKYKGDHFEEFGKIRSKLEKIDNDLLVAERMVKFRKELRRRGRFNVLHGIKW